MIKEENIQVFYFGSPGDGFMALPHQFANQVSTLDNSNKKLGEIESFYSKQSKHVDIIYVIYGLGGKGDNSYRSGRNFGVGIRLNGHVVDKSAHNSLFDFLHRFIYEGINQEKAGIFKTNKGTITEFSINSFQQKKDVLEKLAQNVSKQFSIEYKNLISPITVNSNFRIELDPDKIEEARVQDLNRQKIKTNQGIKSNSKNIQNNTKKESLEPVKLEPKKNNYLGLLWTIAICSLLLSGYNLYRSTQLNKGIKDNSEKLNATAGSGYNNKKVVSKFEKIITNDQVQYYWKEPKGKGFLKMSISSIDDLISKIGQYGLDSNELPSDLSKADLLNFIKSKNKNDINRLDIDIKTKLSTNKSRGVFVSDLSIGSNFIIWQEK